MACRSRWLTLALLAVWAGAAAAQEPDPFDALLPPELLIRHRQEIGLTDAQVAQIRSRVEAMASDMRQLQRRHQEARRRLAEALSADPIDEQATLKRLDELLAVEQEQRRLHLRAMIRIGNRLTAAQRQAAARLRQRGPASAPELGAAAKRIASLSPAEVRARVDALQVTDVAWRKIAWKTCLLDGLRASREQHKPVILWIFIDRPIDDERC